MNQSRKTIVIASVLLVVLFAGAIVALQKIDSARGKDAAIEEVLYLPSGKTVKRLSLGYSSLLAVVYWTRAVQYFGNRHLQDSKRYDLLYPLLDITTDLDPQLVVAYQTGSIFLCQSPPNGAGEPDKAVALLEKGIVANPEVWRMYFTLGFVHYLERKDYKAAEQAFRKGSEVPGALPWMRTMAARMAEHAQDIETAMLLWRGIYETTHDKNVRDGAVKHLASLQAEIDMRELRIRVRTYHEKKGVWPTTWTELVRAGLLGGVPVDPAGQIYKLLPEGGVWVEDPSQFPFLDQAALAN